MKFEWELIEGQLSDEWTERAKVPGGWLIRATWNSCYDGDPVMLGAMHFVKDHDHDWEPE